MLLKKISLKKVLLFCQIFNFFKLIDFERGIKLLQKVQDAYIFSIDRPYSFLIRYCWKNLLWHYGYFRKNFVQKCLSPNSKVCVILFATPILGTLNSNDQYHVCVFYAIFALSFNLDIAKILHFAYFHWLSIWSIATKIILKYLIVHS